MSITTYQIRNVLRSYGNQLKRKSSVAEDSEVPAHMRSDFVEISVEARRKQALNQLSNRLISQLTSKDPQEKVNEPRSFIPYFRVEGK